MIVFLILLFIILILININVNVFILIEINNFDIFLNFKVLFIEIKKSKKLIPKKEKKSLESKEKRLKIDLKKILKYSKMQKINMDISLGTPFLFVNTYLVPIISIILENIKLKYFKDIDKYSYKITPDYENFLFSFKGEFLLKTSLVKFIKYYYETNKTM